jgi:hypothetical protein
LKFTIFLTSFGSGYKRRWLLCAKTRQIRNSDVVEQVASNQMVNSDKEVKVMKRLVDFSTLVALGMGMAVFAAFAPVQPVSAGYYEWDHYEDWDYDDYIYNYEDGWYEYANASAGGSVLSAECSASAEAGAWIDSGSGNLSAYVDMVSSAYSVVWWQWTGGGTPTGGTLTYSFSVSGSNFASGSASIGGSMSISNASSYGGCSADGRSGVTSVSAGCVSGGGEGIADAIVSPQEYATEQVEYEGYDDWYQAWTGWQMSVEDEEEISPGTSTVAFSVSASCSGASADASAMSQTWGASASAYGTCGASASGGASFP